MKIIAVFLSFLLFVPFLSVHAGDEMSVNQEVSGEAILFDLMVLRPLGVASCVLGIAASIVSVPFNVGSPDSARLWKRLVEDPFKYTFSRPLGKSTPNGLTNVTHSD